MARAAKPSRRTADAGFSLFEPSTSTSIDTDEEDIPRDEAGRAKIKQQYIELLGIRVQKLRGRILNRERINKTLEGVYFVCARCANVCHNLDNGLVEDEGNVDNMCDECHKVAQAPPARPVKKAAKAKSKSKAASSKAEASEATKTAGTKAKATKATGTKKATGAKAAGSKADEATADAPKAAKRAAKPTKKKTESKKS